MRTARQRLWFRLVTVPLSLLVLLVAAEAAMRVAGYRPLPALPQRGSGVLLRPSANPDLVYVLVPDARGAGSREHVHINSAGFRDQEYAARPPPGVHRAAVIGDSVTFAMGLPAEQRFTEVAESKLRAEGQPVQVLNLGVGGYDTLQEVAFLEKVGLAFEPERVVVTFCINDLGVHSINEAYLRRAGSYSSPLYRSRVVQLYAAWRDRRSQVDDFRSANREEWFVRRYADRIVDVSGDRRLAELQQGLGNYLQANDVGTRRGFIEWYVSPERVGRLRWTFRRLARLGEEHGFDVAVLIVPYLKEGPHGKAYDLAYEMVRHEARRQGFDAISVVREFRDAGLRRVANPDSPLHPNAAGHEIMGDKLAEALLPG